MAKDWLSLASLNPAEAEVSAQRWIERKVCKISEIIEMWEYIQEQKWEQQFNLAGLD
jgi:hypothetical protein